MKKLSYVVIGVALAVALALMFAPGVSSLSANPCAQCHGSRYSQYLDLVEANSANQIPTSIGVGETKTVSVALENIVTASRYTTLSSVTVSLSSLNSRFSVSSPTFNVGTMSPGIKVATWQITGVSAGADSFLITARANNVHMQISFSDGFSPGPSISVIASAPPPPPPPTSYNVVIQAAQDGTTSPVSGTYARTSGSSFTVSAVPKTGYEFDRWIVNGATMTSNPLTLTITSDTTVSPVFRQQPPPPPPTSFTVTVQSSANGTTSPMAGVYSQTSGSSMTFAATPKAGFKFDFWLVNGVAMTANPLSLTISADTVVSPVFTLQAEVPPPPPPSFTVIVQASPNGTTSPAAGSYSRGAAEVLMLIASPNAGYVFDQWLINGMAQFGNPFNLTVTGNATVLPVFKLAPVQPIDPATPPPANQTSSPPANQTSTPPTDQPSAPNPVSNFAISISSPAENAKWQVGTTQNIEWNVIGGTGVFNVTLEYSVGGFDGPWATIGSNITYSGRLVWAVPSIPATYYVRAVAVDSADPAQVALATSMVEISEAAGPGASQNLLVPAIIVIVTLGAGVVVPVFRNSAFKQKLKEIRTRSDSTKKTR